jgi:DNA-binding transcriptional regulator YbjK
MPRIVDHGRRREEIARLVVRVIQTEGAEAATMRRISRQGGFTIGVLAHYFKDKDQLIAFAFDWTARRSFAELEAAVSAAEPGLARLRAALNYMVPAPGAESFVGVWLALWSGATRNARLAQIHDAYYRRWRGGLRRPLQDALARGEMACARPMRDAADLLAAGVDGLWLSAAFEPRRFPAGRRRRLLDQLLRTVIDSPAASGLTVTSPAR